MRLYLILLKESLIFAVNALVVNRLRTFLSLLGVTIGIFAIISVFTMVDSMEYQVKNSIASLGDDVVFVQKWPWEFGSDYEWWKFMNRPQPSIRETDYLKKRSQLAQVVCFTAAKGGIVAYKKTTIENVSFVGTSHEYYKVRDFDLVLGRYFSENESQGGQPICILGYDIAVLLFEGRDPIGKRIKIDGKQPATVIGVFEKEGESAVGNTHDNQIVMPVKYFRNMVDIRTTQLNQTIMVKAKENIPNQQLKDELKGILRAERRLKPVAEDNFALNESSLLQKGFEGLMSIIRLAGIIIGLFSILVGGFGIANIMFVSVKERTKLIGIQKSLGAKNFFILFQFLSEAIILCLIGGAVGLVMVFLGTKAISSIFEIDIFLSLGNIVFAVVLSSVIGLLAGILPAYSAAKLSPVEAMRAS